MARAASAEIRAEMARQRITGQELARRIGKSQNYVAKRLRDEATMTLNDMESIVDALGLEYGEIASRVADRTRHTRDAAQAAYRQAQEDQ